MEKWLKEDPTLTGSEFDRFLAERASALEKQPHKGGEGSDVNNKPDDKSLL